MENGIGNNIKQDSPKTIIFVNFDKGHWSKFGRALNQCTMNSKPASVKELISMNIDLFSHMYVMYGYVCNKKMNTFSEVFVVPSNTGG